MPCGWLGATSATSELPTIQIVGVGSMVASATWNAMGLRGLPAILADWTTSRDFDLTVLASGGLSHAARYLAAASRGTVSRMACDSNRFSWQLLNV